MYGWRAKRTKIWDSGSYSAHREGIARSVPDSLSLVWGHSVHFAILQFLKLCFSPNFHQIHQNFIQCIIIIQAITFLVICRKLQKVWHFDIFLNTGPYAVGIFKVLFLPQFCLESIQTLWQHWLPYSKSKGLLEYWNEKLYSMFKTFQHILVYWVFSSSRISRSLDLLSM